MKRASFIIVIGLIAAMLLMGCTAAGAFTAQEPEAPVVQAASGSEDAAQLGLAEAAWLLGRTESDAGALLGDGKEYTTEDGATVLGTVYETELCGEAVIIYVLGNGTSDAVSIWISDSSEESVAAWQARVSEYTGSEITETSSGDMQSWRWQAENAFYTLRLLDGSLTLDINAAVGELA